MGGFGTGTVAFLLQCGRTCVYLPTRVGDEDRGATIYGLQANQFIVEDNGLRRAVAVDETPDSWGISMVAVVQCSRSAPAEFEKLKGLGTMIDAIAGAPRMWRWAGGPLLGDFSAAGGTRARGRPAALVLRRRG